MQIPLANSAANAASIASQATAKNNNVASADTAAASPALPTDVGKSEESNKDRDAQGQGDGLGDRGKHKQTAQEMVVEADTNANTAPQLPGEAPHRLDVLG